MKHQAHVKAIVIVLKIRHATKDVEFASIHVPSEQHVGLMHYAGSLTIHQDVNVLNVLLEDPI